MFTKADYETLLGRTVSDAEVSTINLYVTATQGEVEKMLGFPLVVQIENQEAIQKTFQKRDHRHSVFVPVFTEPTEVLYNDVAVETDAMFFDDYNASFFNSVILPSFGGKGKVKVTAKWGFPKLPDDLKTAIFQMAMDNKSDKNISSESVGSLSVSYRTVDTANQPYIAVIKNYSIKGL